MNKYYREHKEECLIRSRKHYEDNRDHYHLLNKNWKKEHILRKWSMNTLWNHRKKNFETSLSIDELEKIAKETSECPICGQKLTWGKSLSLSSPSLDRKNDSKVLTSKNCWIICNRCNVSKSDRTFPEFIEFCKSVSRKFGGN